MEKNYDMNDEIEIDLKELFFELVNNWFTIMVSTVLVAVIAFWISKFIMVPQYESTSELYVLNTVDSSIANLSDLQTGTSLTNDYIVVVEGRPVLEAVIKNLDLEENYGELKEKVSLNNPSNSRILQITVKDPEPQRAKQIADEIAEVAKNYIRNKMNQKEPSIISYGYADGEPVSPNVVMNTLLGAAIGAFFAIAIVIISFLMNDTIMTAEDIERKLGMNVLGTLPLEDEEYDGKKKTNKKSVSKKNKRKQAKK